MHYTFRFIFVILLACACSAFPSRESFAADQRFRIINGSRVTSPNTGVVRVQERVANGYNICSGELLAKRSVLTAWHCVSSHASRMSVHIGKKDYTVQRVFVHPGVRIDATTGIVYNDVAILRLKKAASGRTLPIVRSIGASPGDWVTISGYGIDNSGFVGLLRRGSTQISEVLTSHIVTLFRGFDSDTCNGDSGGPAILNFIDPSGTPRSGIVGITSTGSSEQCGIGDQTFFINLQEDVVFNFIASKVPNLVVY